MILDDGLRVCPTKTIEVWVQVLPETVTLKSSSYSLMDSGSLAEFDTLSLDTGTMKM